MLRGRIQGRPMTDPQTACPDWLDDAAKSEWRRWIDTGRIDRRDGEALAVYSFVSSLRQRVGAVAEALKKSAAEEGLEPEYHGLITVVSEIEERLAADLTGLSATLGISPDPRGVRRPTRILILDEGPFDEAE